MTLKNKIKQNIQKTNTNKTYKESRKGIGGRPLKFKDLSNIFNNKNCFINEYDFCNFLESNIKILTENILGSKYISHKSQSYVSDANKPISPSYSHIVSVGNKSRIDFEINTNEGVYLVECKNPNNSQRELNRAISQILDYIIIAEDAGKNIKEAWLFTTKLNISIIRIIERFNLPISVCVMNKEQNATWRYNEK